jgi:hypothetical protein
MTAEGREQRADGGGGRGEGTDRGGPAKQTVERKMAEKKMKSHIVAGEFKNEKRNLLAHLKC